MGRTYISCFIILITLGSVLLAAPSGLVVRARDDEVFNHQVLPFLSSPVAIAPVISFSQRTSAVTLSPPIINQQGTDVRVTFDPRSLPQDEPSVAVSPLNSQNVLSGANDFRLGTAWLGYYTSFDGGHAWSQNLLPGFPGGTPTILSSFAFASDPAIAFDGSGAAFYSGVVFNLKGSTPTDGTIFVARSNDGGRTFPQEVIVNQGSGRTVFDDKPYLAVDPARGREYVSWTQFVTQGGSSTGSILVSSSSDGGLTWSTPLKVSRSGLNQGSVPAVGPAGEVYVAWLDLVTRTIEIASSNNLGASFNSPVNVRTITPIPSPLPNSRFRTNSFPTLRVDDVTGSVYVAWADDGSGNADILFTRSLDKGVTWSTPIRVNDDTTTSDQFFPWMSVSQGSINIDFYDRRLDVANHLVDIFYAQSADGGSSFLPNLRVTDLSTNPDAVIFSNGQSFMGDYIGVASTPVGVHPVWTDNRDVSSATPFDQDIFTDTLTPSSVIHDVAVTMVSSSRNFAYNRILANPITVNVTVANLGTSLETVTVSGEACCTPGILPPTPVILGSTSVILDIGQTRTVSLGWNVTLVPQGSYQLIGSVSVVPGEANTSNNQLSAGLVQVRIPGDVNGDCVVNISDAALLAAAFGSTPASSNWNPNTDINNDGKVSISDAAILAAFWKTVC